MNAIASIAELMMPNLQNYAARIHEFVVVARRNLCVTGALFPSSTSASHHIAKLVPKSSQLVIEYGPGNGVVSHHLLRRLDETSQLICIEKIPAFVTLLKRIDDKRLHVERDCVLEWSNRFCEAYRGTVDAIVSGIPFSLLPATARRNIISNTATMIKPNGAFIVYQHNPWLYHLLKRYFGVVKIRIELRNFPPYFIMIAHNSFAQLDGRFAQKN